MDPATISLVLGAAMAISEALALIPQVKANGIFHAVYIFLQTITGKDGR